MPPPAIVANLIADPCNYSADTEQLSGPQQYMFAILKQALIVHKEFATRWIRSVEQLK